MGYVYADFVLAERIPYRNEGRKAMSEYSIRGVFWGASIENVRNTEKWTMYYPGPQLTIPLHYTGELYKPFCSEDCKLYYQFEEYWNKESGEVELNKLTEIQYLFSPADGMCEKLYQKLYEVIEALHGDPIEDYPQLKGITTWIIHDDLTAIQLKTFEGTNSNPPQVGLEYSYNGERAYDPKVDYRKQALKELGDRTDSKKILKATESHKEELQQQIDQIRENFNEIIIELPDNDLMSMIIKSMAGILAVNAELVRIIDDLIDRVKELE